ncbi:hypothetical protein H257_12195 [Aphanomyces astaci]|uniref:Uncharacterized protein n=1 Tax=Aphanomyces astaci TaxID=112090 RepID=W4G1B6_APHAT|nr:hypothetical protein H257_12195 [Aphanomyces astaci]ETV72839.1 hypothetical protein H257_12195 [Aphanomyces astaci]|eukprot:XP_009837625.1 hypothetical protein H257_12195 [Aphanomyces astaci]
MYPRSSRWLHRSSTVGYLAANSARACTSLARSSSNTHNAVIEFTTRLSTLLRPVTSTWNICVRIAWSSSCLSATSASRTHAFDTPCATRSRLRARAGSTNVLSKSPRSFTAVRSAYPRDVRMPWMKLSTTECRPLTWSPVASSMPKRRARKMWNTKSADVVASDCTPPRAAHRWCSRCTISRSTDLYRFNCDGPARALRSASWAWSYACPSSEGRIGPRRST